MNKRIRLITFGIVLFCGIVLSVILIVSGNNSGNNSLKKCPDNVLTKDYPEFEGDIYSVLESSTSTAVFVQNVEQADADAYINKLTSKGLTFSNSSFPKTAKKDNSYIIVAYDSKTKKLSITFTQQEDTSK